MPDHQGRPGGGTIRTFKGTETEEVFRDERPRRLPNTIYRVARRKLLMLNNATSLRDLQAVPGNRLHRLGEDRKGQWSLAINDQWRVCFSWRDGGAYDVELRTPSGEQGGPGPMTEKCPIHPGEILLEEFLAPLHRSQYWLAKALKVPPRRVNEIILKNRSITPDTALRLSKLFGISAQFWLGLQSQYDLEVLSSRLPKELEAIEPMLREEVVRERGATRVWEETGGTGEVADLLPELGASTSTPPRRGLKRVVKVRKRLTRPLRRRRRAARQRRRRGQRTP